MTVEFISFPEFALFLLLGIVFGAVIGRFAWLLVMRTHGHRSYMERED